MGTIQYCEEEMLEATMSYRCRFFEYLNYRPLLKQYCEEDKNMSLIYLLAMWILFLLIVFLIVKYIIPKFKPNDFVIIGFSINMN